ncbi:MAG: PH domain-containing protein [Planctomycetota bacterium]
MNSDLTVTNPGDSRTFAFDSAVDWWLAAMLAAPVAGSTAVGLVLAATGRPGDASTMFMVAAAITAVTLVFVVPCRYTLLSDSLSIRCGLICYSVPYAKMVSLTRSTTLASGPALSLRRVVIEMESGRRHIVSPRHREDFIRQLRTRMTQRNPDGVRETLDEVLPDTEVVD